MEKAALEMALQKFNQQLTQTLREPSRELKVIDLRLGILSERLTEISEYSERDLDAIEVHAAQFDGDAPLESVLNLPSDAHLADYAAMVGYICSPSPFAWT